MKVIRTMMLLVCLGLVASCGEKEANDTTNINSAVPEKMTMEEKASLDSITNDLDKSAKDLKKETDELKDLVNDL